jgi:ribonucleoside-diphosphate reductase beta chain
MANQASCTLSELDLFAHTPLQHLIEKSLWLDYEPSINYDKGRSAIQVKIIGNEGLYIDLSNILVYCRLSISKTDGTLIKDTDEIGPINYIHNTLFKQVEVRLNGKLVSTITPYAYRSFIEARLNHGTDSKKTILRSAIWEEDTEGEMENTSIKAEKTTKTEPSSTEPSVSTTVQLKHNKGFVKRRSYFLDSTVETISRPHIDIVNVNKYLPDLVDIELKFIKNTDEFCLMGSGSGYRINIEDFKLYVRKVQLTTDALIAQNQALNRAPAILDINKVDVHTFSISQGLSSTTLENISSERLPQRIILGMVDQQGFNGSLLKNPFNFQHFNISEIDVTIDGNNEYRPFQFNFEAPNKNFIRGYQTIIGLDDNSMINNNVTMEQYLHGFTVVALNIARDGCINSDHNNAERKGNLRIKLSFSKPLDQAITVVLYSEYQGTISISGSKREVDNLK